MNMKNFEGVRFVLIYTMFLNLLVTAAKIAVGYITGSLSILADGFDSLFDSLSNVIGLIAIYLSRRPADESHPYGHRRYEILMTLVVSVLLFFTCFQILKSAYQRLLNPIVPVVTIWSFASLLLSIAVHLYVAFYERRRGQELRSEFLIADASHTSADILVTTGVIGGLIVVRLGYPIIDTALAVVIAFLIAKIGVDIIRSSSRILTDAAALEVKQIADIVQQVPGVESYHRIRSRGQEDDIHLDLHIRVVPDMPLAQAHAVAHEVQRRLQQTIEGVRDVVVHVEPQRGTATPAHGDLFTSVRGIAHDAGLTIHHLNAHEINGHYSVDLHLEVPSGLTLGEAHTQASSLEDRIKAQIPEVTEISTHIEPAPTAHTEYDQLPQDSRIAQKVCELVLGMPEVHDCHDVQVHQAEGKLFVTMHCTLDEHLPIGQAHDIATLIEDRLRNE